MYGALVKVIILFRWMNWGIGWGSWNHKKQTNKKNCCGFL